MRKVTPKLIEIDYNKHATTGFNLYMYEMLALIPKHVPDVVLESFYRKGFVDALDMLKDYDKRIFGSNETLST